MAKEINPNLGKDGVFKSTDRDNSVFKEVEIKPVSPIKKHRLLSIFKRSFGDKVAPEIPQQSDPTSGKLPPLDHKTSVHIPVDELKSEVAASTRLDDAKKLTEKDLINNDLKEVFSKAGSNIQSVTHELIDGSKNIGITVIKTGHLTGSSVTRKYVLTDAGLHKVLDGKEGWEYESRTKDLGFEISHLNKCIVRPRIWSILKLEDEKERLRQLTDFTLENYFSKNRLADCFNTYEIEEIAAILAKDGVEKTNLTEGSLFQELAIEADSLLTNLEEKEAEHLKRTEATITDLFNGVDRSPIASLINLMPSILLNVLKKVSVINVLCVGNNSFSFSKASNINNTSSKAFFLQCFSIVK